MSEERGDPRRDEGGRDEWVEIVGEWLERRLARGSMPEYAISSPSSRSAQLIATVVTGAGRSRARIALAAERRRPSPAARHRRRGSRSAARARRSATGFRGPRRCSRERGVRRSPHSSTRLRRCGSIASHGLHQGAQKSTTTGPATLEHLGLERRVAYVVHSRCRQSARAGAAAPSRSPPSTIAPVIFEPPTRGRRT